MAKTTSTPSVSTLDARRRHDQVELEQALVAAAVAGAELARLRPATHPAELERIADRAHRAAGRLRDAAARAMET